MHGQRAVVPDSSGVIAAAFPSHLAFARATGLSMDLDIVSWREDEVLFT